jgi:hypothetical protein
MKKRPLAAKLPEVPLLISESNEEFRGLANALRREIKPSGIVERIFVDDVAHLTWEIVRLRRCQLAIVNLQFRDALFDILRTLLPPGEQPGDRAQKANDLSERWYVERQAKSEVQELLQQYGLDVSAIEARAFIEHADELERIDQLVGFREARRLKALSSISAYREAFAQQVRESSDRLIARSVREVEDVKPRAAA